MSRPRGRGARGAGPAAERARNDRMDVGRLVETKARAARAAAQTLAVCPTRIKDDALLEMARGLEEKTPALLEANRADVARANARGVTRAFLDRLTLTEARIGAMAAGVREIAALPDPVGTEVESWRRPNGIEIARVRVPLGVIGFVYESRPNVTADAAALCLKAGNAVLLRGGREAVESNGLIAAVLARAVEKAGGPGDAIQFVDVTDREAVAAMLALDGVLDLVIPRGGEEFVRWVAAHARVPVLKHDKGLVHVFVDDSADVDMATRITLNAKTHRPGVCNAMETLLVDAGIAPRFLPPAASRLREAGVELRGCPRTRALVPEARPATDADWDEEYLDLVLAVRVVDGIDAAIAHIRRHGTGLAEAIASFCSDAEKTASARFVTRLQEVDMPPPVQLLCYQVVREAVMNAVKHSGASEVRVSLERRLAFRRILRQLV